MVMTGDGSQPPRPDPIFFRVRVDSDRPLAGAIEVEGESAETEFQGWMELMAAITGAQSRVPPTTGDEA
jgi:hypothetical protein